MGPHHRISTLSLSRSSFTDTPSSTTMMMIKVVLTVAALLAVAEGECYWSSSACNVDNLCSYGCHKGSCFSQCNGISWMVHHTRKCGSTGEWCWLKGKGNVNDYKYCSNDSDCQDVMFNDCYGTCSL